ncbi:hypothetical protein D3C73_1462250 [compost metagenome]
MVLLTQRLEQNVATEQADLTNPPVSPLAVQYPVGQQCLMGAVKGPESNVHHAAL